jgi:hypothetical protein
MRNSVLGRPQGSTAAMIHRSLDGRHVGTPAPGAGAPATRPLGAGALFVVGSMALMLGAAVYLVARGSGTSWLPAGLGRDPWPALTGALPALWHTLAFALLAAAAAGATRRALAWSAGAWTVIGVGFELTQHPRVAVALWPHPGEIAGSGALPAAQALLARYGHLGTFDPLDLVATAAGGSLALLLGSWLAAPPERLAARAAPLPAATARLTARGVRGAAVVVVAGLGVASLLATSPPPPSFGTLFIEPSAVCPGGEVTVRWALDEGLGGSVPPGARIVSAPADAFDPPLDATPLSEREGARVTSVRHTAFATLADDHDDLIVHDVPAVTVMLCEAIGRQWTDDPASRIAALGVERDGDAVVLALPPTPTSPTRLVWLDADLDVVASLPVALAIADLAVEPGGAVVAVGSEGSTSSAAILALSAAGGERWSVRIEAPEATAPLVTADAIARAPDGDLLVAGTRRTIDGRLEAFVHRYAADGTLRWARPVGVEGGDARASGVAVAPDGTVAMAGSTTGVVASGATATPTASDVGLIHTHAAFLVTFDADGTRGWTYQSEGSGGVAVVATGPVGGWLLAAHDLIALRADGSVAWTRATPEDATLEAVVGLGSGGGVVAYRQLVRVDLPTASYYYRFFDLDHFDIVLTRVDPTGAVLASQHVGTHLDERVDALRAWSSRSPETVVLAGATWGELLVTRESGTPDPFVLVVDE